MQSTRSAHSYWRKILGFLCLSDATFPLMPYNDVFYNHSERFIAAHLIVNRAPTRKMRWREFNNAWTRATCCKKDRNNNEKRFAFCDSSTFLCFCGKNLAIYLAPRRSYVFYFALTIAPPLSRIKIDFFACVSIILKSNLGKIIFLFLIYPLSWLEDIIHKFI